MLILSDKSATEKKEVVYQKSQGPRKYQHRISVSKIVKLVNVTNRLLTFKQPSLYKLSNLNDVCVCYKQICVPDGRINEHKTSEKKDKIVNFNRILNYKYITIVHTNFIMLKMIVVMIRKLNM